jgi:ferritin-like protein
MEFLAAAPSVEALHLDIAFPARERAIYLLHIGAQVEHALMAQYFYAACSLGGPHLTDQSQQRTAKQWRDVIVKIAREEMGHLATVENLLTLVGGPLMFEREDYPIPKDLYPFDFELEPLGKKSLGKYVLAEMPAESVVASLGLTKEIEAIRLYVGGDAQKDSLRVHRVGLIYEAVQALFQGATITQEPPENPDIFVESQDISSDSRLFQARPEEWGLGYSEMLVETAVDRASAKSAIQAIATQGEGSTIADLPSSHFGRFLEIYRNFPIEDDWRPARNASRNPTTDPDAPEDRRITNVESQLWAKLLNIRYRMLLMFLKHSFYIEAPTEKSENSPRGLLISWSFGEMYNLRSIADILMSLPMREGEKEPFAGPPFEMPYTLSLSTRESGRWRQHRDLILASQEYVNRLKKRKSAHELYLLGMEQANGEALTQITALLGGIPS